jgi:hypothetical protein
LNCSGFAFEAERAGGALGVDLDPMERTPVVRRARERGLLATGKQNCIILICLGEAQRKKGSSGYNNDRSRLDYRGRVIEIQPSIMVAGLGRAAKESVLAFYPIVTYAFRD